jgi:hypothetical protein
MKMIVIVVTLLFVSTTCAAQTRRCVAEDKNPYPNELPTLKIYRDAKWKSLRPLVSTKADIEKVLGKPVAIYDELLQSNVAGYDDDFDWTIVVSVVGKGGELPDSVVDRLADLTLYPKRRVSLVGADFSTFMPMSVHDESGGNTTVYYDACGLRYVVYSEDATNGRFHVGDLKSITYGFSQESYNKQLTGKP